MKPQAISGHPAAAVPWLQSWAPVARFVTDRYLLLPIGALLALVWANVAGESYFRFAHALAFPVNEIGMALFLGLVAQAAIEATLPGGALHQWRRWAMPVIGAAGGIGGAALTYLAYVFVAHEAVLGQAWPIACAIDVAASYYVLRLVAPRSAALPFLLVLAIASDAVGVVTLAVWRPLTLQHVTGGVLVLTAMALAALLRRRQVDAFWPYIGVCGAVAWAGFARAEVHPALALVPIVPFLPHAVRRANPFTDRPADTPVHHAEHAWHEAIQIVLFLFGLVNAGVLLTGYDTGTWAILTAALVGRPLGIVAAVAVASLAGLRLPPRVGWRELIVVACATSAGFTLALFFARALLPVGAVLQQITFGALLTAVGAGMAVLAARVLRVGRFADR